MAPPAPVVTRILAETKANPPSGVVKLWSAYEEQTAQDGRNRRIDTSVYAGVALNFSVFRHPAVLHAGLRPLICQSREFMANTEIPIMHDPPHSRTRESVPGCQNAAYRLINDQSSISETYSSQECIIRRSMAN
ncbi:hypothetical protein RvY_00367 [Ramazzottius varieornatus]|uniref:Uncharacterized protein n=1 Tax=Ramazzottius varieornatus TaxID=947166 RepID=A0A1D1UJW8_RAMVA|nr:hypothetical protein RvY_00367 [Ramazzottius varieornatus]